MYQEIKSGVIYRKKYIKKYVFWTLSDDRKITRIEECKVDLKEKRDGSNHLDETR